MKPFLVLAAFVILVAAATVARLFAHDRRRECVGTLRCPEDEGDGVQPADMRVWGLVHGTSAAPSLVTWRFDIPPGLSAGGVGALLPVRPSGLSGGAEAMLCRRIDD